MKKITGVRLSVVLLTVFICLISGCCSFTVRSLDKAKQLANKQDYASLAGLDAGCKESCDGCN